MRHQDRGAQGLELMVARGADNEQKEQEVEEAREGTGERVGRHA